MNHLDSQAVENFVVNVLPTWGARVAGALVTIFIAWTMAAWLRRLVVRNLERARFDTTLTRFIGNMVRYTVLVIAGIGCLGVFGIQTTSFAAVLASAGLAVGLAFQGTLSNFASGVMLLVFRPFKVGDVVRAGGEIGSITELELFTTEMTTADNRRLIIPNSKIFGDTIENITHHATRRVEVEVGTAYDADLDKTREVLERALAAVPNTLDDPARQVFLAGLGASSIDWKLRVWCKTEDFWDVHQALVRAAKVALDADSIGIPFPQTELQLGDPILTALSRKTG